MSMSIRTNISSLNAQRNLSKTQNDLDSSLSRLSSGYRITRAGDDAAGLGISTNLEAQIRSYTQATRNANDGLSLIQTAEGSLNEVANILTRMRELTMQAASDGIGTTERGYINTEAQQLSDELDRIDATAEYNGNKFFGATAKLQFQVGIRGDAASAADNVIEIDTTGMEVDSTSLGVNGITTAITNATDAATAQPILDKIDTALQSVSDFRAQLGAAGNRFQSAINTITQSSESLSAANSRIKDVDVAEETSRMSRSQILAQAGVAVLAQANQMPQMALKLLG